MARLVVTDRRWALLLGVAAVAAGSWLLSQAYEARGRSRPAPMSPPLPCAPMAVSAKASTTIAPSNRVPALRT